MLYFLMIQKLRKSTNLHNMSETNVAEMVQYNTSGMLPHGFFYP